MAGRFDCDKTLNSWPLSIGRANWECCGTRLKWRGDFFSGVRNMWRESVTKDRNE